MSKSKEILDLLTRTPDGERISKIKVVMIIAVLAAIAVIPIAQKAGKGKQDFQDKERVKNTQSRQNAVDISMSEYNKGGPSQLQQTVETMTQNKNNRVESNYINGMNVPITGNKVPGIGALSNESTPNYNYSERPPLQNTNNTANNSDPVYQELQQEKVDRLKHRYAGYRADTLVWPNATTNQSISGSGSSPAAKPQGDQPSNNQDNQSSTNQAIPQPTKMMANMQPSDGYAHVSAQGDNDQNQQAEKNNFMLSRGKDQFADDVNASEVKDPASKYMITQGTNVCIYLLTKINADLPGAIVGRTCRNVYDSVTGNQLLIPKGSKVFGNYDSNVVFGQNRVMAVWNRVIFPNGTSYRLNGMPGTDAMGTSGLTGEVNNHLMKIYGGALAMSFITGASQYSQNNTNPNVQVGGIGVTTTNPSIGQTLSGSLGQQMGQAGMQVMQKNLNVQPTIEIEPGEEVTVMLTSDVVLRPFNRKEYAGNSISTQNKGD